MPLESWEVNWLFWKSFWLRPRWLCWLSLLPGTSLTQFVFVPPAQEQRTMQVYSHLVLGETSRPKGSRSRNSSDRGVCIGLLKTTLDFFQSRAERWALGSPEENSIDVTSPINHTEHIAIAHAWILGILSSLHYRRAYFPRTTRPQWNRLLKILPKDCDFYIPAKILLQNHSKYRGCSKVLGDGVFKECLQGEQRKILYW